MSWRGWCLECADARRYAWTEQDGVYSEEDARARLALQEPAAVVVRVVEEEIVMSVDLGEN